MDNTATMKTWTSETVVTTFLDYFRSLDHVVLPSSSLVPEDDPTVLLTTAGMQQMIPFMLGRTAPPARRLASVQKCFRTTDVDRVGDQRHLTFFEMLGNFSIGDYFKQEIIPWSWELVTRGFEIPAERVSVTVHPTDEEAVKLWQSVGLPSARIVHDDENFWGPPGASGPCGPDTELYYDRGEAYGCGQDWCRPGCDCERYLEFWNLVFMQYFQNTDGNRQPLEQRNVDTGMGLERVTAMLQKASSVYETDLFRPIILGVEQLAGVPYGRDDRHDYALRVLADHGRAMTFLVGDGVLPSNEGRGYVLRRVVRRSVRYGQQLGLTRPFLADLAAVVIERMTERHPILGATATRIQEILRTEEQRFLATLQSGLSQLDRWIEEARAAGVTEISGEHVFRLYDTHGFPRELSEEIAAEAGVSIRWSEYEHAMNQQRERSRGAARFGANRTVGEKSLLAAQPPSLFVGYDRFETESMAMALQHAQTDVEALREGDEGTIVLAETPFYAEGGGQVGDTGEIVASGARFVVFDTQRDGTGHIMHIGKVTAGEFRAGDIVQAAVDVERRRDVMRHHSVTHLLHKALQLTLGPTAVQAGSLVAPHVARFDFPHEGPLNSAEVEAVEDLVNRQILSDLPVIVQELPFNEAIHEGATAFFGEKYGERVRVVTMGDYSKELCGGTHVSRTGELGAAYIAGETGIGSGMRRVEVVAGRAAQALARDRSRVAAVLAARLGTSVDHLEERAEGLMAELREARREAERLGAELAKLQGGGLVGSRRDVAGIPLIASCVDAHSMDSLLQLKDAITRQLPTGVVVLGALIEGRPQFVVEVSRDLIAPGFDAVAIVKAVAAVTGGGGGGQPHLARAGGRDGAKLEEAIARAEQVIRDLHPEHASA
jgi:alanyl-tRNA synthetase